MADNKSGFKYYNVDTDRYQDMKIKRLKKEFRCDGIAVYDYILCEIYRVRGCFTEWDDNFLFDVADYFSIDEDLVSKIVVYCCNLGLFDKILFEKLSIITSRTIQERFIDMSRRAKRLGVKVPEEIRILREESPKVREESPKNTEVSDKVEYSRENESEVDIISEEKSIYEKIDEAAYYLTCPEEQQWRDIVCMQNKIEESVLLKFIEEFTGLQKERGEFEPPKEFRSHFANWLKIEKKKLNGNSRRNLEQTAHTTIETF